MCKRVSVGGEGLALISAAALQSRRILGQQASGEPVVGTVEFEVVGKLTRLISRGSRDAGNRRAELASNQKYYVQRFKEWRIEFEISGKMKWRS